MSSMVRWWASSRPWRLLSLVKMKVFHQVFYFSCELVVSIYDLNQFMNDASIHELRIDYGQHRLRCFLSRRCSAQ